MNKIDTDKLTSVAKDIEANRNELVELQYSVLDYIKQINELCKTANVDLIDEFESVVSVVIDDEENTHYCEHLCVKYPFPRSKKSKAYQIFKLLKEAKTPLTLTQIIEKTGIKYTTVTQYLSKYECFMRSGDGYIVTNTDAQL